MTENPTTQTPATDPLLIPTRTQLLPGGYVVDLDADETLPGDFTPWDPTSPDYDPELGAEATEEFVDRMAQLAATNHDMPYSEIEARVLEDLFGETGPDAAAPDTMTCYVCGGYTGTGPQRQVVGEAGVTRGPDPSMIYILVCNHQAIAE